MTPHTPTLSTLRRITLAVVFLVGVSILAIVSMVIHAGREQNRIAVTSAGQQFQGLMQLHAEQLTRQTRDYAHWDDAIRHLVTTPNPDWWRDNAGEYAIASFDLAFSMAVSSHNELLFFAHTSAATSPAPELLAQPSVQALLRQSRQLAQAGGTAGAGTSGWVRSGDDLYLVSVALFAEESDASPRNPDPGAALLFGRAFSQAMLSQTANIMGVMGMEVTDAPGASEKIGQPITLADGGPGGFVRWWPDLPGHDLLSSLGPWLAGVFLLMLAALVEAARRTSQLTRRLVADASRVEVQAQQIAEAHARLRQLHEQLKERVRHTERRNRSLEDMAMRDGLTQLGNRRSLQLAAERLADGSGGVTPFSVLMVDVDHFKSINDQHGHDRGDLVLTDVAQCLRQVARAEDEAIRYGGEEFVLILPQTRAEHARQVADRIHDELAQRQPGGLAITVSIGVATSEDGLDDLYKVLKDADDALYLAKRDGRNQTIIAMANPAPQD